jgi:hypothetical protein
MENKIIPTAEEWLKHFEENAYLGTPISECMIEFAKLHVEQALKAASEKVKLAKAFNYGSYNESEAKFKPTYLTVFIKEEYGHGDSGYVAVKTDTESILNSYPLSNIK